MVAAETVTLRLGILDIVDIDDRQQQFEIDAFVEVTWRDPRLASESAEEGAVRTFSSSDIWMPSLLILNNRGLGSPLPDTVTVDNAGNVVWRQRLVGPLAADLALRELSIRHAASEY